MHSLYNMRFFTLHVVLFSTSLLLFACVQQENDTSFLLTEDWDVGAITRLLVVSNNRLYDLHYDDFEPSLRIHDVEFDTVASGD
ncbi:MAG: hypothetical protein WD529_02765 [Balneolaceae bacterium]